MTTRHTTIHIIQQYHTLPQGPTQAPTWLGVLPANKRSAATSKQEQVVVAAEPLAAEAADTPSQHDNDTCYEGDEEDHSSSSSQHSSDSDLGSCRSGSSGEVTYPSKYMSL
ncbi:expressed unknown protein [Ectocarpus siliculosus]|uniref:Uncharacterized protein n=1 Tax=Ectocarpus siliculosus TaxID=2880 RepID=D8LHF3_ECTSI|nr:expressed unknown protein [Ectocarpus siliculosus]|eukprot:CBN80270.1 expressed unknown protein [Ectocarpus siliculosus]